MKKLGIDTVIEALKRVESFFVIYLIGYSTFLFLSLLVGVNEIFEDKKKKILKNKIKHEFYFPISIIVPAFNEEITILNTINSLIDVNYKKYEIIIVNDGSTDGTLQKIIDEYNLKMVAKPICKKLETVDIINVYENNEKVKITLIDKENSGKADSINVGINASEFGYFVCMDADSILEKTSLEKIVRVVLEDENVVAVGSMIRVSNDSEFENGVLKNYRFPRNIIAGSQVLEYERSFLASRIFLDKFNSNLIISGAFGLFHKQTVINIGGYAKSSMGEDMELIIKLHSFCKANQQKYSIRYSYDAVCWTQVPEKLSDLVKQRRRWHIGLYESLKMHRNVFIKFSYIYYLIYELLSPIIELFGLFFIFLALIYGILSVKYMLSFFFVYALFGATLTLGSFLSRNFLSDQKLGLKDVVKAIVISIPETLFLRFILMITRITSVFYMKNRTWGRIKRIDVKYKKEKK